MNIDPIEISFENLSHMRFDEFSTLWMREYAEKYLKERTLERFRQFSVRTNEALGSLLLCEIRTRHIQCFINELSEENVNCRTGGALAPKTVRGYLSYVSSILKYAWRMEIIAENPCNRVMLPPLIQEERKILDIDQTIYFMGRLSEAPVKYEVFFKLAIFTGLRRGELLGLDWHDIDFEKHIVTVRRNSQYTKRKGTYADVPKTRAGVRVLKLPEFLFDLLKRLRRDQMLEAFRCGIKWSEDCRLFLGKNGEPLHPNCPYNWLKRFSEKIGIPFYGVHQFRHINASLLISSGADPRTVAYTLGHTQVSTTLNIYAHEFSCAQAEASSAVGDILMERLKVHKVPNENFGQVRAI